MAKNFLVLIIIGLVFGVFIGLKDIQLTWWHFISAAFIFIIVYTLFFILINNRFLGHIKSGKFEKAIDLLNKQKHFGKKALRKIIHLNKAICYTRMGEFTRSIEELDKINQDGMDKNSRWSFYGLYASNLLLLEDRIGEAIDYMKKANEILQFPSSYLVWSNLEQLNGNFSKADELMRTYENMEKKDKKLIFGMTFLWIDQKFKAIYDNFLIGLYYLKNNETEKAIQYLKLATLSEVDDYYTSKARELISDKASTAH